MGKRRYVRPPDTFVFSEETFKSFVEHINCGSDCVVRGYRANFAEDTIAKHPRFVPIAADEIMWGVLEDKDGLLTNLLDRLRVEASTTITASFFKNYIEKIAPDAFGLPKSSKEPSTLNYMSRTAQNILHSRSDLVGDVADTICTVYAAHKGDAWAKDLYETMLFHLTNQQMLPRERLVSDATARRIFMDDPIRNFAFAAAYMKAQKAEI